MTHKSMRKAMAAVLSAAMLFQMGAAPATQAAAKVKLAKKSIVLTEKKSKTVKVTGVKKAKIKKVKWSVNNKKVAAVKASGKTAVKVTAKKAGSAKVTGKFTLKGSKRVQKVTLKVKVTAASKKQVTLETTAPASGAPKATSAASASPTNAPSQAPSANPNASQAPSVSPNASQAPSVSPDASQAPSASPDASQTPAASQSPEEFQPVLFKSATFEEGTDDFVSRGSSKVSQADNGYEGKCLYVTGRTDAWNGAAIDVTSTIVPGAKYRVTAYMKQMSGDTTPIKCSVQMGQTYPEIATVEEAPSGEWVKIEGEIEVASSFSEYLIYFEMPKDKTADFYLDSVEITQISKGKEAIDPDTLDSIKDTYKDIFQYMGTCANYYGYGAKKDQLTTPKTVNFIKRQFNSITLENEMKPDTVLGNSYSKKLISVEEAKNLGYVIPDNYADDEVPQLSLDAVDKTLEFCAQNNVKMRAHTLMWHQQTPNWFFAEGYNGTTPTTPEVMDARLEFFVRTVMRHVMDKEKELTGKEGSLVYAWDVTNEYIHRTNEPTDPSWMDVYGDMGLQPSYVKKAFTIAYEELENRGLQNDVTLFYNDYDEYNCADDIVSLVNFINSDKKICGGIGMQSHLTGPENPTIDRYAETLDKFLATGLEVQVTELDAEVKGAENDEEGLAEQAAYMKAIMETIVKKQLNRDKNVNPKGITGVTVWGLYDSCSWRSNIPLLFGSGINDPKPSFYAFIEAAKAR